MPNLAKNIKTRKERRKDETAKVKVTKVFGWVSKKKVASVLEHNWPNLAAAAEKFARAENPPGKYSASR